MDSSKSGKPNLICFLLNSDFFCATSEMGASQIASKEGDEGRSCVRGGTKTPKNGANGKVIDSHNCCLLPRLK